MLQLHLAAPIGAFALLQLAAAIPAQGEDPAAAADAAVAARAEATGFRGQVLIRCGDDVAYEAAFGAVTRGGDDAISPETLFYIGSIAKPITSTVVLQLVAGDKLALDTPLGKLLDGVPDDKNGITVEQLLSHTAGLVGNHDDIFADLDRDQFVAWALAQPLEHEPGTEWSYSNVGYSLLAAIVERCEAKPFQQVVAARVFEPAGMKSARFVGDPSLREASCAVGTGPMVDRFHTSGDARDLRPTYLRLGCGGILCTARDLLAFDRAIGSGLLLPREWLERAWTPVQKQYGLGWRVMKTSTGETLHWHDGGFPGFNAEYFRGTRQDAAIVALGAVEDGARKLRPALGARAAACVGR